MYDPEQAIYDEEIQSSIQVHLGIDEHPDKWWQTIYYALQITLVDFTPFIWAGLLVSLAGLPQSILPVLIAASFISMGIGTLIQTTIGNRLPIVQGPSASLVSSMGGVAAVYGLPAMWGAVIVGGFIEFFVGASRVMSKIRRFMPPVVIGSVVASIGFVAAGIAINWTFSDPSPEMLTLALLAFLFALYLKYKGKGIISHGFILVSVVIVGVIGGSALGVMEWSQVRAAPWFALPRFFPFKDFPNVGTGQTVAIVAAAIIGGFTGYVGSMFESIGDYAATCAAANETFKVKHIDRGIMAEGLSCVISGLIGGLPTTSYTQNIGIIAATGVTSRRVTQVAAVLFLLYGMSPKLATFLVAIPRPVIGAVFLITASLIMMSGFDLISSSKDTSQRDIIIAGTTLGASVAIPQYAATTGVEWAASLPPFLNMFVKSNIFIAVISGIVLNLLLNVLFKYKREKKDEDSTEKAQ